jgi:hypothetical protein
MNSAPQELSLITELRFTKGLRHEIFFAVFIKRTYIAPVIRNPNLGGYVNLYYHAARVLIGLQGDQWEKGGLTSCTGFSQKFRALI